MNAGSTEESKLFANRLAMNAGSTEESKLFVFVSFFNFFQSIRQSLIRFWKDSQEELMDGMLSYKVRFIGRGWKGRRLYTGNSYILA